MKVFEVSREQVEGWEAAAVHHCSEARSGLAVAGTDSGMEVVSPLQSQEAHSGIEEDLVERVEARSEIVAAHFDTEEAHFGIEEERSGIVGVLGMEAAHSGTAAGCFGIDQLAVASVEVVRRQDCWGTVAALEG